MSARHQQPQIIASRYVGILPQADELVRYNSAVPNAAERIIVMAEKQAVHRQDLEERALISDRRRATAGLICAFVITLLVLTASTYLIMNGHDVAGVALFGGSLREKLT